MSADLGKPQMRRQALARRRQIPCQTSQDFARSLAKTGLELVEKFAPRCSGAYVSLPEEASTEFLLQKLAEKNLTVALPITGRKEDPLSFRAWRPGDLLNKGKMGILEPVSSAAELLPDLLFVPLAGFDRAGYRIGYGGGYYDRTLAKLRSLQKIVAIGLGFACQEVGKVPVEAHDQKLDYVLTEAELITCQPG
jgi:5-formyltetrahydrofolate cyclo-ligase